MRLNATANDESTSQDVKHSGQCHFTLMNLFTFLTVIPVAIGVLAAVKLTASNQTHEWFGIGWQSDVRLFLIENLGLPPNFVTSYVAFAIIDMPAWVCYFLIALLLGLIRATWAFTIGVAFITAIVFFDLLSDYFSGLHGYTNLRLISVFSATVAALGFAIARRIRNGIAISERKTSRIAVAFICVAIVTSMCVSIYGWWLVERNCRPDLEIQEIGWSATKRQTPCATKLERRRQIQTA